MLKTTSIFSILLFFSSMVSVHAQVKDKIINIQPLMSNIGHSINENNLIHLNNFSSNQKNGSNDEYPAYSHLSVNTGLGSTFGPNDFTKFKSPIMIFWENGGDLGHYTDFIDIPNWIFYGAYVRFSKHEVNYYNSYSYGATTFGAGIRTNVSILPMVAAISGKEMKKSGPFEFYGGVQLGYDYVFYDGYLAYYGYYGTESGLKVSPFAGARFYLLKWLGVHAELGSTSGRYCSVGINIRSKH